ncbi:MAG: ribonuclease PH [Omnitrophica WOR_2 bacterium RIFCSPHIGHO2_01_FULL_48_9]|nr:MAG: ribonuclease PH [Omnitrophica WOR_2 bacterium RIFCSPHIGHO2_01_FULL_48_9]
MSRIDGRKPDELRPIKVTRDYIKHAEGSCLIEFGETRVICTATVEEDVPQFLRDTNTGWVTAEYGMLPRSCTTRIRRDRPSGRVQEIQRLVGRSLRGVVDLERLGSRTVKIDCDVIQADGGTRTASITGGFIALADALLKIKNDRLIPAVPIIDYVAAISVGILRGQMLLDLNYEEDSKADIDMNVVMVGQGRFVEVQGTAEGKTFDKKQMDELIVLAQKGIQQLFEVQKENLIGLRLSS